VARHENRRRWRGRGDQLGAAGVVVEHDGEAPARASASPTGPARRRPCDLGIERRAWRRPAGDRWASRSGSEPLVERRIGEGPGVVEEPRLRGVIDRSRAHDRAPGDGSSAPIAASTPARHHPAAPAIPVGHRGAGRRMAPGTRYQRGTPCAAPASRRRARTAGGQRPAHGSMASSATLRGGRAAEVDDLDARGPSTSRTCVAVA